MINNVVIEGRLTTDPELRHVGQKGTPIVTSYIANNVWTGAKSETHFFEIVIWGKQAENYCRYLRKGSKVMVQGTLKTQTYTKDGNTIKKTAIQVKELSYDINKKATNDMQTDESVYNEMFGDEPQDETQAPNIPINADELPFY